MKMNSSVDDNNPYLKTFDFQHNPFPVAPDDAFFYLSDTIEEIIEEIVHGVCARKGFIMLSGDVGLGKTTISRRVLSLLASRQVATALVLHTNLQETELLRAINRDFGIAGRDNETGLGDQLACLNDFLLEQNRRERNCAIIIDDAQNLNPQSLELIRMISNLESDQQKLVQIILVGQTELGALLNTHAMRQLDSRIVIRKIVRSLTAEEMRNYIAFKLNAAGDRGAIRITQPAYRKLYRLTKGNFRNVNLLMDRCLYGLYGSGSRRITRKIVKMAWADLYGAGKPSQVQRWAWGASFGLALLVMLAAWGLHLKTGRSLSADTVAPIHSRDTEAVRMKYHKVPQALASLTQGAAVPAPGAGPQWHPPKTGTLKEELPVVDPAVSAFLGIYELDDYAGAFQKALEEGNLEPLARRIYAEKGFQLIALESVPDKIRNQYGALAFSLAADRPPTWLLFWRPRLRLKRFYYRYQGEEIIRLQKLFADLNLYNYELDGIVGPRLMDAVVTFQKQQNLPVTGFPDARTLFRLCHAKEATSHG